MKPLERFLARPERNVGSGDFLTRLVASLILAGLIVVVLPHTRLPHPVVRLSLLGVAELGLVILMLGLFLRTKTHFAGLQLLVTSLSMLWLVGHQLVWPALAVGSFFLVTGVVNLVTRRSRLNQVLNLSSIREVISHQPVAAEDGVKS